MDVLDLVHRTCHPRTYLEIGVRHGDATSLALPGTKVVGVDPAPSLKHPLPRHTRIERRTSDDFFDNGGAIAAFQSEPIDLAFIDGMHLFEFALRDVLNVERCAAPGSMIMLHDCLPPNVGVASREFQEGGWTGDVWKVLLYLRDHRPDLDVCVIDASPTGLGVIQGLDPTRPPTDHAAVVDYYVGLGFSAFTDDLLPGLSLIPGDVDAINDRVGRAAWQHHPHLERLVAVRDRRRARRNSAFRRTLLQSKKLVARTRVGKLMVSARRRVRR